MLGNHSWESRRQTSLSMFHLHCKGGKQLSGVSALDGVTGSTLGVDISPEK